MSTQIHLGRIGVQIYGKSTHTSFERVSEIEEVVQAPLDDCVIDLAGEYADLVEYEDDCEYIQQAHNGYKVRSILERYEDGVLVERKLIRRVRYAPCAGIKVCGTKKREEQNI